MRISWKPIGDHYESHTGDKSYKIVKASGGSVWELFQIIEEGTHGYPATMTQYYLTNAKSLAAAKKIASELYNGKVFLDDNRIPRKIENTKKD
tara:strand:- start:250 stop:528 length:279 start_codon:yes stop_codon:yes gene_type:complete